MVGLIACSPAPRQVFETDTMVNENKEALLMPAGTGEEKIWIDRSLIVGIVSVDSSLESKYSDLVEKVDMEWYTPPVSNLQIGVHGEPSPVIFKMLKRKDGQPISNDNSAELEVLRETFPINFGPGMFYETGQVWGILTNVITIRFERETSEATIQDLLKAAGAERIMPIDHEFYRAEFPKRWGYKIIDVGKELFKLEEVNYVENQYNVINTRS